MRPLALVRVFLTMKFRVARQRLASVWMRVQLARPVAAYWRKVASAYNLWRRPRTQAELSKPCDSKASGRGFADSTVLLLFIVSRLSRAHHNLAYNRHERGTKTVTFCAAQRSKDDPLGLKAAKLLRVRSLHGSAGAISLCSSNWLPHSTLTTLVNRVTGELKYWHWTLVR